MWARLDMPAADRLSNVILERLNREVGRGDGVVACSRARFLLASSAAVCSTRKSFRRFFSTPKMDEALPTLHVTRAVTCIYFVPGP